MDMVSVIIQLAIAAIIIFFISGRLIGSQVSLGKRILSVVISVAFTTFVFWYTYLRDASYYDGNIVTNVINISTLLWLGSMLLISMLLYLFFELFDPIELNENGTPVGRRSYFKTLITYWRRQKRLRQVVSIAVKNGVTRTMKYARSREDERELAKALRDTLEQCGGIFVKFGQVLSTRKELLPPIFIEELEKLQQHVRPLSEQQVDAILKENLKGQDQQFFSYFDKSPLASASIGQVHKAVLKETNEPVVVKLLRPEVKGIMTEDLTILMEFAGWITSKSKWAENLGFYDLAKGFSLALSEEIDFHIEARNMEQMGNIVQTGKVDVKVPKVFHDVSNENLIVMEFVKGKSVSVATDLFQTEQVDRHEFAKNLLYAFLEQALISGIFHADPHPGNIYLEQDTGKLVMLDYGAVGRLAVQQQDGLKYFLVGIHQNDAALVVDGISLLVENAEDINRLEMEQAISQILLKINFVSRIPTDVLIYSIFSVARDFGLHFYPAVSVALRAVVTLDGTLGIIHPGFEIFSEVKDFSNDYLKASLLKPFKEPRATKQLLEEELALMLPNLRKVPRRIDQLFKKVESGKIILHHDIFSDKANAKFVTQLFSRFVLLLVGITFGIISVALLAISQFIHTAYAVYLNTAAYLGLFLCAILLVRLSIQAIRDIKRTK
ncbi:ABC transporter [Lysinibacillus sp. 2017]|uniref:ABC1 kinase family protein n=1 Tax=unclassified Lysinibacillus TaxID=2636778 RepID=UPI000D528A20|nr:MULTISPECIES: AarF/UbiB family protein [unclassified Lysinibacillus]AWE08487.1 ABC transporter [Lysinibacillus sp. 2017]TGN34974.1 AarF/ABC1/UbiB kinase family protein [Lysinibacillus sp. S2017]